MNKPLLTHFHDQHGAEYTAVNGARTVACYESFSAEYHALSATAGILDFSFRGRICLTGADRVRFLHGQVTNDIKRLHPGTGWCAAVVNAKGRMEADLNVYCLQDELLLDFEPGLTRALIARLEKYIVADDVQVVDVAGLYGLLSVQGPAAGAVIRRTGMFEEIPVQPYSFVRKVGPAGEVYLANQ